MPDDLAQMKCVPCEGGVPPLKGEQIQEYLDRVDDGWEVVDEHHLTRRFTFDDFQGALDFTNRVGAIAEEEGHHPNICLTWGEAEISVHTHAIDGLSENDFILAAKIDRL
jgi:4a-hydroxytetrahydrobiopterin dehydratase